MKRYLVPVAIGALIVAFWLEPQLQEIAAGIAIFLFGMLMLEDGFKLFGGGLLERLLARATGSLPRSLLFGIVSTTLLQSSSLVSVLSISFLSAGLISLVGGLGVIFGANLGTTTGAWLVAGIGLKVDIAAYAMPMIALSIILVFQKPNTVRGLGYALAGLGFLFLGIHYMKEGFETFQNQLDLTRFALQGIAGLVVYSLMGMAATVVMQSSHATLVLTITALSAGQITYDNALALAIGANIGTTITAIIGALGANYQGKRLALAHLIFNATTAAVALILISPLRETVDLTSAAIGIAADDYALKLAVFHTIFNALGIVLMLPLIQRLARFLTRVIVEPVSDVSYPQFLNKGIDEFPSMLETALRKEVQHLYENAEKIMLRGLNLRPEAVLATANLAETVRASRTPMDFDLEAQYERRIKPLHAAIVDYASRAESRGFAPDIADQVHALRDVAGLLVQAIKSVKHLRKNVLRYSTRESGTITDLYDGLRTEIARILVEIYKLASEDPEDRSSLWMDQERAQIEEDAKNTARRIDTLIRTGDLNPIAATSFLNDSHYAYDAMRDLIAASTTLYAPRDKAMAEVERLLALDEEEILQSLGTPKDAGETGLTPDARSETDAGAMTETAKHSES
jgi:phosphate:Na+ symporter